MTTKKANTTKTETSSSSRSTNVTLGAIMNALAFVAVCIGGIALFLAMLLKLFGLTASWIGTMQAVANAIGWIALCVLSINYIKHRRKLWIWIVWTVAVVMIFTGIIVPLFA